MRARSDSFLLIDETRLVLGHISDCLVSHGYGQPILLVREYASQLTHTLESGSPSRLPLDPYLPADPQVFEKTKLAVTIIHSFSESVKGVKVLDVRTPTIDTV